MSDDIDIEEHDILKNPRVQGILPVIQNIKSEMVDFDDEMVDSDGNSEDRLHYGEENEDLEYHYSSQPEDIDEDSCYAPVLGNKIILGSKPNPEIKFDLKVSLEDWGQKLKTNPRYCKDCKILFATMNAIDAHKMAAHSHLVAINIPVDEPTEKVKFCDHCKTTFEYDKFIQHLYDVISEKRKQNTPKEATKNQPTGKQRYYVCPICTCHFTIPKNITIHCFQNHSMKVEIQEPILYDQKCRLCSAATTTLKHYNIHIKTAHPNLWNEKRNVKKSLSMPAVNESILKKHLSNPQGVQKAAGKQADVSQHVSKVIAKQKALISNSQVEVKTGVARFIHGKYGFISTNVLFKCDSCPLHFHNCLSGINHANHDHNESNGWTKCDMCQRGFRPKNMYLHELQHRMDVAKFKVFVIHDNIYARVLCKCPGCYIHFDERSFMKHTKDAICGETSQPGPCSVCKVNINNLPAHALKHTEKDFLRTDFIWVEDFIASNSSNSLKRTTDSEEEPAKRPKSSVEPNATTSKEIETLYFCSHCKCFTRYFTKAYHTSKECRPSLRLPCTSCGLPFLQDKEHKHHKTMHRIKNIHFKNFTYVYLSNSKPIDLVMIPSLIEFPKCTKCGVRYAEKGHVCYKSSKLCRICNQKFSDQAYALHTLHHNYFPMPTTSITSSMEHSLKSIYEKLKPTWDILYKCTACDIMSDSYDGVVEHCQRHYNKIENFDLAIINCRTCSINFDEKSYERHRVLHCNQGITSDSFTVLNYDYFQLLTDDWPKVLEPLPEELRQQIQTQSIYVTRQVKLSIECNGPADKTLYKCNSCKLVVHPSQVLEHTRNQSICNNGIGLKCSICSLAFTSSSAKQRHEQYHSNCEGSRIVTFNSPSDKDFNQTLFRNSSTQYYSTLVQSSSSTIPSTSGKDKLKRKSVIINPLLSQTLPIKEASIPKIITGTTAAQGRKFVYYQCQLCTCCCKYGTALTHKCFDQKDIRSCELCLLNFPFRSMYQHKGTHDKCDDLTPDNIKIVPFNQKSKVSTNQHKGTHDKCDDQTPDNIKIVPFNQKSKVSTSQHEGTHDKCDDLTPDNIKIVPFNQNIKVSTIYMCSCNLHFLSEEQIKAHFLECTPHKKVPSVKCSKCGYPFPTDLLVTHLVQHHSKPGSEVVVIPTETFFRCGACGCHFRKRMALCNHQRVCDGKTVKQECSKCGLEFSYLQIYNHQLRCAGKGKRIHNIFVINATRAKLLTNQSFEENNAEKSTPQNDDSQNSTEPNGFDNAPTRININSNKVVRNALFKCTTCNCHFNSTPSIAQHLENYIATGTLGPCPEYMTPVKCPECNLYFNHRSLSRHMMWHQKYKISMENVIFYVLDKSNMRFLVLENSVDDKNPKDKPEDKTDNAETASEDNPEGQKNLKIDASTPEGTGDYFSAVAKIKLMKSQNKSILYKCNKCNLCYLTHASLHFHFDQDHVIHYKPHLCRMCGLTFPLMTMGKHRTLHHKDKYYDNANLCVVTVGEAHSKRFLSVTQLSGKNVETIDDGSQDSSVVVNEQNDSSIKEPDENETIDVDPDEALDETIADDEDAEDTPPESDINLTQKLKELQKSKSLVLYKCGKCNLYYMNPVTLAYHAETNRHVLNFPPRPCDLCGLNFTSFSIERHKKLHHPNNTFPKDKIYVVLANTNDYRDIISIKTLAEEDEETNDSAVSQSSNSANVSMDTSLATTPSAKPAEAAPPQTRYSHKLYKCGLCNVYFLSQNSCYKHVLCHEPMDPRDFIDCKFCNLSFRIASLSTHVKMHHARDFELDKVLVEEYAPGENKKPEIDIYYAIDKVQSRLVSTTTEEKVESSAQSTQSKSNETQNTEVTNANTVPETQTESNDNANVESAKSLDPVTDRRSEISVTEKPADDAVAASNKEKETSSVDTVTNVVTEGESNPKDSDKTTDGVELDLVKTEPDTEDGISKPLIEANVSRNSVITSIKREVDAVEEEETENEHIVGSKTVWKCIYCNKTFSNKIGKDFHESLDHLDGKKNCPICNDTFNISILNEMHLEVKSDFFTCCICSDTLNIDLLFKHSKEHSERE